MVAKVDAAKHQVLAKQYGVEGFPTIKLFPKSSHDGEQPEPETYVRTHGCSDVHQSDLLCADALPSGMGTSAMLGRS